MRGGNSRHTRNLRAAHDKALVTLSGTYSEDEFWQDLARVTRGNTDRVLAQLMIHRSAELVSWLIDRGVRFQPSLTGAIALDRTNAFFLGGGCALLNALYLTAEKLGVDIRYNTCVEHIELDGPRFTSIWCRQGERTFPVSADALIVASGGFQANLDWLAESWGEAAHNFIVRGTPNNDGRLLANLMQQGAATVGDPTQCHAIAVDARAPQFDGGIVSRTDAIPYGVVVNTSGERFYDEGEDIWPRRYAIWGRLIAQQPDQTAYVIYDATAATYFMPSALPPVQAPTLEALIDLLQLPRQTLVTLARYNDAVVPGLSNRQTLDGCRTQGLQPDKTNWAQRIETAPFLAYPLKPGITFTYLGLKVDTTARVQLDDGTACSNLFAAGEIMAGNILGEGYCAGTGMTIGGVFGRIAGREASVL